MAFIGIDLGTTNSVLAHQREDGSVVVLKDEIGNKRLPVIISFSLKTRLLGAAAKAKREKCKDRNNIVVANRLLGSLYCDVANAARHLPYRVVDKSNRPRVVVDELGKQWEFDPVQLASMLLEYLLSAAADAGLKFPGAFTTAPPYFTDEQRPLNKLAEKFDFLPVLAIINERLLEDDEQALSTKQKKQLEDEIEWSWGHKDEEPGDFIDKKFILENLMKQDEQVDLGLPRMTSTRALLPGEEKRREEEKDPNNAHFDKKTRKSD